MRAGDRVTLTADEIEDAFEYAKRETNYWLSFPPGKVYRSDDFLEETKGKMTIKQRKVKNQFIGRLAEIAFCNFANIRPEYVEGVRIRKHDVVYNTLTFDIKGTDYMDGQLFASYKTHEIGQFDAFALIKINLPIAVFSGWCFEAELISEKTVKNMGHGDTYVLPVHKLRKEL